MSETSDALAAGILDQPSIGRVALVWRGDATAEPPAPSSTRFHLIFASLNDVELVAEPVLFSEEAEDAVRARLLAVDGVLVWVDPSAQAKTGRGSTRCCAMSRRTASG